MLAFLGVIKVNNLSKWGTDPNISYILLHQDILRYTPSPFHFLSPENIKKSLVFWCFQGVQKWEYWPEMGERS